MSAISQAASGYTGVKFNAVGDAVAGRIIGFEDYQVTDWQTKAPKFFPSGDPIMGTRVHLETEPGNEDSRVTVYVEKVNMLKAVAAAMRAAGRSELTIGDDLAITHTGMDGRAKAFTAAYETAE